MKHVVCKLSDVAVDGNKAFTVAGRSVLICRSPSGVYAVENRCAHMLASLEGGKQRGVHLFCPKHGARFDLRTGIANQLAKTPIQTFAVELESETISIELIDAV